MKFVKVIEKAELPANQMMIVSSGGNDILLTNVDGTYYAILNKCTHLGGSLGKGVLEGHVVTCPRHGAQFDVRTGKVVGPAQIAFLKMTPRDEVSYPVKVEGTDVLIGMPE